MAAAAACEKELRVEIAALTERLQASSSEGSRLQNHVDGLQRMLESVVEGYPPQVLSRGTVGSTGGGTSSDYAGFNAGTDRTGIVVRVGGVSGGAVIPPSASDVREGLTPLALWERVQELTVTESGLRARIQELEEERGRKRGTEGAVGIDLMHTTNVSHTL